MAKEWHQGGEDHKALAEWMMYRAAATHGMTDEYADMAWDDDTTRGYWMTEAWATLVWIHDRAKADKPAPPKYLGPEWRVPRLCDDGIHDFKLDEDTGAVYCGKCDYWEQEAS